MLLWILRKKEKLPAKVEKLLMLLEMRMNLHQKRPGKQDVKVARHPEAAVAGKQVLLSSDTTRIGNELYRAVYVVNSRPIITGDYITDAQPQQDPMEGTLVTFSLNNEGGRRFRNETGKNIQKQMAIILDNRVMGRPPTIQSAIGTRGQITMGGRSLQAAQDLADADHVLEVVQRADQAADRFAGHAAPEDAVGDGQPGGRARGCEPGAAPEGNQRQLQAPVDRRPPPVAPEAEPEQAKPVAVQVVS